MTLVGAGYRSELRSLFAGDAAAVDCAEIVANRYFSESGVARPWELDDLAGVPIVVHGLSGNVASVTGPDASYLGQIERLADYTGAVIYSDHLAFTAAEDRSLGHLAPNLFDDELLEASAAHIEAIRRATGRRVRLENLATNTMIGGSKYTPEEYYLKLLEESQDWDCLLDVTNLWINSQGRDVDPLSVIDAIPPERLSCVHLAGGEIHAGELIDTHSQAVHAEVFDLLAYLLERAEPEIIIIERDSNWGGAEAEVRADLARVRDLLAATRRHRLATAASVAS